MKNGKITQVDVEFITIWKCRRDRNPGGLRYSPARYGPGIDSILRRREISHGILRFSSGCIVRNPVISGQRDLRILDSWTGISESLIFRVSNDNKPEIGLAFHLPKMRSLFISYVAFLKVRRSDISCLSCQLSRSLMVYPIGFSDRSFKTSSTRPDQTVQHLGRDGSWTIHDWAYIYRPVIPDGDPVGGTEWHDSEKSEKYNICFISQ
jgi:hypothetical protein